MLERRFVKGQPIKVRAAGGKPGIEGYAAVFNEEYNSGWFVETIAPGAFSTALKEKHDVRCLFNHDANNLLGRTKSNTLTLTEDGVGLHFSCDLNPDTRVATEVHAMVDRGDLDGCSFAFLVTAQVWTEKTDDEGTVTTYRTITDLKLFDVGPVTYPAYEGTSVGARALWPDGVPSEVRSHIPALRDAVDGDPNPNDPDGDGDDDEQEAETCSCRCLACQGCKGVESKSDENKGVESKSDENVMSLEQARARTETLRAQMSMHIV